MVDANLRYRLAFQRSKQQQMAATLYATAHLPFLLAGGRSQLHGGGSGIWENSSSTVVGGRTLPMGSRGQPQ